MKKNKRFKPETIVAILVLFTLLISGCGGDADNSKNAQGGESMLNQRQQKILEEQGLPTEYGELTVDQKNAIASIEAMLCYLEEKYDDSFEYEGYIQGDGQETERLIAACSKGTVTVYRYYENGAYRYEDNYGAKAVQPDYAKALNEYFATVLDDSDFILFSDVSSTEEGNADVLAASSGTTWMFIDASAMVTSGLKELVQRFADWIAPQLDGHACMLKVYIIEPDAFTSVNGTNYEEMTIGGQIVGKLICSISDSGEINIF